MIARVESFLSRRNYSLQIVIFLFAAVALDTLTAPFTPIEENIVKQLAKLHPFMLIILGPLVETFLFQCAVIWFLNKSEYLRKHKLIPITISATLFAIVHTHSNAYIIYAFFPGLLLAYIFSFYSENYAKAFFTTFMVHAAHNALVYLVLVILTPGHLK